MEDEPEHVGGSAGMKCVLPMKSEMQYVHKSYGVKISFSRKMLEEDPVIKSIRKTEETVEETLVRLLTSLTHPL